MSREEFLKNMKIEKMSCQKCDKIFKAVVT